MKKILNILSVLVLVFALVFTLAGCGNSGNDKKIVVGTMAQPGEPILNSIKEQLAKKGYTLEVQLFSDFSTPNIALDEGSIDANLFQHEPYLNTYNSTNNTNLYCAALLYDCVYGGYTKKNISLVDEIPSGSKITIANDSSNMKRCLLILEAAGLIELNSLPDLLVANDVNDYIKTNNKNLVITPIATDMIAASLDDEDVYLGLVNATFAIAAGLTSNELLCKEEDPQHVNANILACRTEDKDSEKIKALVEALTSATTAEFINNQFGGTIIPYFVSRLED